MQKLWRGLLVVAVLLLVTASVAAIDTNQLTPHFFDSSVDFIPQFDQNQPSTSADVIVLPREAEQGASHQITVSGLQTGETVTIRILEDASGTRVYNSSRTASDNGRVQVDIFTTSDDATGAYTVEIVNSAGDVIGTAAFTILETSGLDGEVIVTPDSGVAGSTHTIDISNVRSFLDMEVVVLNEAEERVFVTQVRATVDGEASVNYTSTPRDGGDYRVIVRADDTEVASAMLQIDGPVSVTELTLVPEELEAGEDVIVSITGLDADETVTVIVTQAGSAVDTVGATADVNGNIIFFLSTDDAPAGIYDVRVVSAGGVTLAQASYTIAGGDSDLTFVITPQEGDVETMFVFAVTGLEDGETVTVQLLSNGDIVLEEDITAAPNGAAALILNQDNGLTAGDFIARLVRNGVAVAQAEVVVTGGEAQPEPTPEPTSEPTAEPTDVPPQTGAADITIEPDTGAIPTNYDITASGLEAGSTVTIRIVYEGDVIYSVDGLVGNSGTFTTSVVSEESDPPGEYTLELVQDDEVLDSVTFIIEAAAGDSAQPTPAPTEAAPTGTVTIDVPVIIGLGDRFEVGVTGLTPGSSVTIGIEFQDAFVFTTDRTADADGSVVIGLQTDGTEELGTYAIVVSVDGNEIARQNFDLVADTSAQPDAEPTEAAPPQTSEASITVDPPAGAVGTDHQITVTGLNPNETVTLDVLFDGDVVFSSERTADGSGAFIINLTSEEGDPPGVYEIRVSRDGQAVASADLTVGDSSAAQPQPTEPAPSAEGEGEISVTIDPQTGDIGTTHNIAVSGLEPNANVTLEIRYDGNSVFTTDRIADAMGNVVLAISSESGDPEGTYTVTVIAEGAELASGDFVVGEAQSVQPQPTDVPATAEGEVVETHVTIDPQVGDIGTTHNITVNGLTAGANVTLEIRYDGNSVYSTTRTADATGTVILAISSESGDPEGTYTVVVIEDGAELASGDFVIGEASTAQPQPTEPPATSGGDDETDETTGKASVVVDPAAGDIGTTHNITVTGLTPNTDVTLEVRLNGESVYTTARTSDAAGSVLLAIQSEEGDSEGTYTVVVIEDGVEVASGDFVIGEASTSQPQPTEAPATPEPQDGVSVTVDPLSGAIGTAHTVTVTGLEANESVTFEVTFGDETVFSTARTADAGGTAVLTLTSEDGDSEGLYTVAVLRGETVLSSADFTIGEATTVAPTPSPDDSGDDSSTSGVENVNLSDSLTTGDPEYRYPFSGNSGDSVVIRSTSNDFDSYLILEDADGNRLAENDDGGGGLNSQIGPYTLPETGTYVAVVSSYGYINLGEVETGDFNLTIESLDLDIPTTDLGTGSQAVTGNLTEQTPSANFTFTGEEGETVLISQSSSDFDSFLVLLDESGSELISNDDSGSSINSQIGPYTLPYSGTYTVVAGSYSYRNFSELVTGQFTLRVERVMVSSTSYGETSTVNLTSESSAQILSFEASAGDVISVTVEGEIDTVLTITDPDGFVTFSDDDGGMGFNPEVPRYVIPFDGTFSILVSSFTPGIEGSVDVTLAQTDVRSLDTDTRTVSINAKQTSDILTLDGVAGSRINLNISLLSGEVGNLNITVRQGENTLMFYQTFGMPTDIALGFEVPADGAVSIVVEDFNSTGATLEFSITTSQ